MTRGQTNGSRERKEFEKKENDAKLRTSVLERSKIVKENEYYKKQIMLANKQKRKKNIFDGMRKG